MFQCPNSGKRVLKIPFFSTTTVFNTQKFSSYCESKNFEEKNNFKMKKSYLTFLLSIGLTIGVNAQSEKPQSRLKYVYSETTPESIQELKKLTEGNNEVFKKAKNRIAKYEKGGDIILSTEQYSHIQARINNSKISQNDEELAYADKARKKYVVVTDLLK